MVDEYVRAQMKAARIPGLALAIVQDGQAVHVRGFGRADNGGRAFTPRASFFIGSNTKSFTALAVMQLAEAGLVELDAPVQRYILSLPKILSAQVKRHAGTRGGCRRGGRVCGREDGWRRPGPG